jgi:hypothetical protein
MILGKNYIFKSTRLPQCYSFHYDDVQGGIPLDNVASFIVEKSDKKYDNVYHVNLQTTDEIYHSGLMYGLTIRDMLNHAINNED